MKLSKVLEVPSIRVLLFIYGRSDVRHGELQRLITSRGTLSLSLRELEEEGLIRRSVVASKPIQSYYSLTEKGDEVAKKLKDIRTLI